MGEHISTTAEIALAIACDSSEPNKLKLRFITIENNISKIMTHLGIDKTAECITDYSLKSSLNDVDKQIIKTMREMGRTVQDIALAVNLPSNSIMEILAN